MKTTVRPRQPHALMPCFFFFFLPERFLLVFLLAVVRAGKLPLLSLRVRGRRAGDDCFMPVLMGGGVADFSCLGVMRALGMGSLDCNKHCGQTIMPSLAMSCSLLISSFLPHLGQVQRIVLKNYELRKLNK